MKERILYGIEVTTWDVRFKKFIIQHETKSFYKTEMGNIKKEYVDNEHIYYGFLRESWVFSLDIKEAKRIFQVHLDKIALSVNKALAEIDEEIELNEK